MDFGYDANVQSYPNTMHFFSVQVPHIDSTNISPLDMNITPTDEGNNAVVESEDDDPMLMIMTV